MTHVEKLLGEHDEEARRNIPEWTWAEMLIAAFMSDQTGQPHAVAPTGTRSIDIIAPDGRHVQVKTARSPGSPFKITETKDMPAIVVLIALLKNPRFFLISLDDFTRLAKPYDKGGRAVPREQAGRWEIRASRAETGALDAFEIPLEETALLAAAFNSHDRATPR